jgi:dnd system-associated protein 4
MGVHRVRIAQDKAELVKSLLADKGTTGTFATYADMVAFAASMGMKRKAKLSLEKVAREPAPIALEIFISRGYDWLIQLIALTETATPKILAAEAESQRIAIFEEYANGGLAALQQELVGAVDYTERLLLILNAERFKPSTTEDFDLSRFL